MLLEKFRGTSHSHKIFTSIEIATPAMNVRKICKLEKQYEIDMWSMMQAEKHFCKPTMNSILNFPYILQCPSFAVKYVLLYCRGKILTPPPSCICRKRMGITYNVKL